MWFPGISDSVQVLKSMGFDVVDPVKQDNEWMWNDNEQRPRPSFAFRNLAMLKDIEELSIPNTVLFLIPGWNQFPEAIAMYHVATAMGRIVKDIPNVVLTKEAVSECSSDR